MVQKLVIFLKFPEAGKVKTRLARSIGDAEAARIYRRLAEETVERMRPAADKSLEIVIVYDPPDREAETKRWIRGPFKYIPQGEGDLGQRMSQAALRAFREGAERVVLIGSDCPGLDLTTVDQAFGVLSRKDVVLGPSEDGGYYLAGLRHPSVLSIFENIPWSTPAVLEKTIEQLVQARLSYELLSVKTDVDTLEDLRHIPHKISVIIPAFNEENSTKTALLDLTQNHDPHEIIVADGGSSDQTAEVSSKAAKVISSKKGRAAQMNAGAAAATGDIFLFLHADTRLPTGALTTLNEALRQKNSGRFRMSFGHPHPLLRFYAYQTRFHFFSYGDQAFFVTREVFQRLGGFREDVPFEDIDFYRRLLRIERPAILKEAVITSPRRFLQNGIVKQKFINISLASMVYLGFKNSWIQYFQKRWYRDIREPDGLQNV